MTGFAVRKDGLGWRAVSSPSDCTEHEIWQETRPEVATTATVAPKVTMRQARLALLEIGKLFDVIDIINRLPEPPRTAATIEWDYASEVERRSPLIDMLAPQLGLTDQDVDELFNRASVL